MIRVLVEGISQERAGIGSMIMAIYRGIDKSQIQFDFIIPEFSVYEEEIKQLGGKCYKFPRWMKAPLKYSKMFKKLIKENDYNYFWIHSTSKINVMRFKFIKKNTDMKIITHAHGTNNEYKGIKGIVCTILEKFGEKVFYKNMDYPFACSKAAADYYYDKEKLGNKKITIINNTIELNSFKFDQETRDKYRREFDVDNKKVLLMAGRLAPIKNVGFAVRILAEILKKDDTYLLMLAGDGPEKDGLTALSHALNIEEKVMFLGNRKDINKIYLAADALLMPSFNEGFPVTIIEAQASGLNCFISNSVTEEVAVCNTDCYKSCFYLQLNDAWTEAILKNTTEDRIKKSEENITILREKGYDSKEYPAKFLKIIKELK